MYTGVAATPSRRESSVVDSISVSPGQVPARVALDNSEVLGLPFLFQDSGAQLIAETSGRVLWLSGSIKALAAGSSCIGIEDGNLCGRSRHSDRLLREVLAEAERSGKPVAQLIARAANDLPELFIRARTCSGRAAGAIALTIRELNRQIDHFPDLTRLYGLTPTEQQITKMMLRGRSVTEIAQELNKSVLTVRTHIKRTYVKFNVGTKEQLFSTVIRMMVD